MLHTRTYWNQWHISISLSVAWGCEWIFFEADIYDAEFLGDRLVPFASPQKKLFSSYLGFRPFFGFHFSGHNSKTAHFWGFPVFFNFLSDCLFTFFLVWIFIGKTPYLALSVGFVLLGILRGQKMICFGKKLLLVLISISVP